MAGELAQVIALIVAAILGIVVGYEREIRLKPAGIRTHMLVAVGACLFTIISSLIDPGAPSRVSANIVVGIGFLGAGMILKDKTGGISGLTTSASVWATAAIGLAVGAGFYVLAIAGTILTVIAASIPHPHSVSEKLRE